MKEQMELVIDSSVVWIQPAELFPKGAYCLGTIENALGNLIAAVEDEFPEIKNITGEEYSKLVIRRVSDGLSGEKKKKKHTEVLWGLNVSVDEAYNALNFDDCFDGKSKIKLTLKDVELWRVRHTVNKTVFPSDTINASYSGGLRISSIVSIKEVIYGLLFYYAVNDFKIAKCEHCGKWFATKTFKYKFCNRRSPVPGYTKLNCEQAVQNIRQQCGRVKDRIDTKARNTMATGGVPFQDWFWTECDKRRQAIKKAASAELQIEYLKFLSKVEEERKWLDNSCIVSPASRL